MQGLFFYGLGVAAVVAYGVMHVMAKKAQINIPPFTFMAVTMIVLTLSSLAAAYIFEKFSFREQLASTQVWFLILYGFINFIGFALYLKAISGMSIAHYQLLGVALGPVIVAGLALPFLGEQVGLRFFIAIPIILSGLYIAFVK